MNNTDKKEDALTLELLEAIDGRSDVTQRHLADRLGVALGLANSYLRRCARKGLIKIQHAPANRYLYYLTPKGFAEKSRLTAEYLSTSFDFYRRAGASLDHIYIECQRQGWDRILLCGVSELAEIASIRAQENEIHLVGTFDPDTGLKQFLRMPIWQKLGDAYEHDACVLTALINVNGIHRVLTNKVDKNRILIPAILGISNQGN